MRQVKLSELADYGSIGPGGSVDRLVLTAAVHDAATLLQPVLAHEHVGPMASLTAALQAAVSEVEAIEAGRLPARDIADLVRIDPEVLEAGAVRLGADPEEAEIMVAGIWRRLSQVIAQARLQLETKRVRQLAMVQMLEETRLAS